MREFFYILLGYLSGSILFAKIVPQKLCHVDVTRMGKDQNPGTFNAFAAAGPLVGTFVLLLELGKGFFPVHLALKPVVLLAVLYLLFSLVLVVRPHLYRSVLTFVCFAAGCLRTVMFPAWKLGCLGISAVVCWRHIRSGEREPLTFTFLPVFDKMKENKKKKEWEVWK